MSQPATALLESPVRLVSRPASRVLLIEDNPIDASLICYALKQDRAWQTILTAVDDPEKAIYGLTEGLAKGTKPDYVILDLNLPKQDGAEVLAWMRRTPGLQDIPAVVLSSSPIDLMQKRFHEAGVLPAGYFTKPIEVEAFIRMLKDIRACLQGAVNNGAVKSSDVKTHTPQDEGLSFN
jgi:CheY-like chemotaxis protein